MSILFKNCGILTSENGKFRRINGFLGVNGDAIDYIGEKRPEKTYGEEKDMTGKLLIPGLINAHSHVAMTLLRGVGSGLPLDKWLFDCVFPTEDRLSPADIKIGTYLGILEMLACGTTSFSDMYFESVGTAEAVLEAGIKANICRPVQQIEDGVDPATDRRVRESMALYDEFNMAGDGRLRIDFGVHAEYTCNERIVRFYSELVNARGGNMHIHLSETRKEHEACIAKYGKTPAEWFRDLGAFDSGAFAAHCVAVSESDIALLKEKGVKAVHNPASNLKLGSGFMPLRKLQDAGITVGLGTDGASSNNNLNMFEEMHLASVIHSGVSGNSLEILPGDVLKMATVNGAKIQRRDDTGELAVGKKADIAAVSMDGPHMVPDLGAEQLLVYSAQGSDVCMTMADGRILYENGEYKTLDKERIIAEARAVVKRIYG